MLTSDQTLVAKSRYEGIEEWNVMIDLLIEIEAEYDSLFFPEAGEEVTEDWKKIRQVAMPSFLSYFNQGPLNYEEQKINWIRDIFTQLDGKIEEVTGLRTEHFLQFYENLDTLLQAKFRAFTTNGGNINEEWMQLTNVQAGVSEQAPEMIRELGNRDRHLLLFLSDEGIIHRFKPEDLISPEITLDQVTTILQELTWSRKETDFLYYTETKPGNPLYDNPIIDIGNGVYQVFEVKQVLHSIEAYLESIFSATEKLTSKLVSKKGKLLEDNVEQLFRDYFGDGITVYTSYYVDGHEQDILILWDGFAFIIEAKGYKLREPFRDPDKAFVRIKSEFKGSIGYAYEQTKRVEKYFKEQTPLRITDSTGKLIEEIDTTKYEDGDFSIIVNLHSYGVVQNDLSYLLEIEDDDVYPWVTKLDDLEVFLLTLKAKRKKPGYLIDYLYMREELHGKLICADELEVCGGYILGKLTYEIAKGDDTIVTSPDLANLFDKQYAKGMGFENEKYLKEKKSGKFVFW